MARCGSCGGLGRVAAGGMTSQFIGVFWSLGGGSVRECRACHGTGEAGESDPGEASAFLPAPRTHDEAVQRIAGSATASRVATQVSRDLSGLLHGEWLVEVHGYMRILAVMKFRLTAKHGSGRFDAVCDFGGPPGWEASGIWELLDPGNAVRLTGVQFSPYLITTDYLWGATLDELNSEFLHGESVSGELTTWHRTN